VDSSPAVSVTAPVAPVQRTTAIGVAWQGTDAQGIARYDVQRQDVAPAGAPGAWFDWLTGTTATTGTYAGAYGHTYCFRIRATDRAGDVSPYASPRCSTIPLRASQLSTSGNWRRTSSSVFFAGSATSTTTTGATASHGALVARRVYLLATRCARCGSVDVRWNGARVASVGLRAPTTRYRQLILVATFPAAQTGSPTVTVTNPSGAAVVLEGLAVTRD
jgi:hypothetical protein